VDAILAPSHSQLQHHMLGLRSRTVIGIKIKIKKKKKTESTAKRSARLLAVHRTYMLQFREAPVQRSFTARCRCASELRRRHWPSYRKWMRRGHFPPTIAVAVRNSHVFPLTLPSRQSPKRTKALSARPPPDKSSSRLIIAGARHEIVLFIFSLYTHTPHIRRVLYGMQFFFFYYYYCYGVLQQPSLSASSAPGVLRLSRSMVLPCTVKRESTTHPKINSVILSTRCRMSVRHVK